MRKREQFAVSLRKAKTKEIIAHKRRRLIQAALDQQHHTGIDMTGQLSADMSCTVYDGYYKFNKDSGAWRDQLL